MKKDETEKSNSRRKFLQYGLAASAATVAGGVGLTKAFSKGESELSGETVKLLSPDGSLVEVDKAMLNPTPAKEIVSNLEARKGIPGKKFVMVIDLAKCRNARKCVIACGKMHSLAPNQEWIPIKLMQDSESTAPYWFPKPCFHCDNPPCVKVCPVDATFKRQDGIVLVDNQRCIGCKFCMAACPYSARVFNWEHPNVSEEVLCGPNSPEGSTPPRSGVVSKCDFCPDKVREGKLPDCVPACPNGVIYYGDKNEDTVTNGDETVRFSELIRTKAGYRYLEELGTEPSVYYLPPTDRLFPVDRGLKDLDEDQLKRYEDTPFVKSLKKEAL